MSKRVDRLDRVVLAQGLPCVYCKAPMTGRAPKRSAPTRDHIVPRRLKGRRVVMCCYRCNLDKGPLVLPSWHRRLMKARDPRAAVVGALLDGLKDGTLRLVPGAVATLGVAPGVFA